MQLHLFLFAKAFFKGFARAEARYEPRLWALAWAFGLLYCITDKYINLSFNLKFTKFLSQNLYKFQYLF